MSSLSGEITFQASINDFFQSPLKSEIVGFVGNFFSLLEVFLVNSQITKYDGAGCMSL